MIEKFSEALHDIWSTWFWYQLNNSTPKNIKIWKMQASITYAELSEEDKQKYRDIFKRKIAPLLKGYQRYFIDIIGCKVDLEDIIALHINEARRLNMTGTEYIAYSRFQDACEEKAEQELDNINNN